jgi:hypothetical protein
MNKEANIITRIDLPEAHITYGADGIVYVRFKSNIVVDVPLQMKLLELYNGFLDKHVPFLFEAEEGATINKEARDNSRNIEHLIPFKATAVVVGNIAQAMVANFYMKFNKPNHPYKVFNKREEAVQWLKQYV